MIKVVQDLKSYDACKKEVHIQDSMYSVEHTISLTKDTIITNLKANLKDCKLIGDNYEIITKKQQEDIDTLKSHVVLWKTITGTATVVFAILLIL